MIDERQTALKVFVLTTLRQKRQAYSLVLNHHHLQWVSATNAAKHQIVDRVDKHSMHGAQGVIMKGKSSTSKWTRLHKKLQYRNNWVFDVKLRRGSYRSEAF